MPVILVIWKAEIGRIAVRGQPRQIVHETPSPKTTRAKWTGGVVQMVNNVHYKHEALSSNPTPTKKKKKKKKKQWRD
jgi:hypothetical protein